MGYLGTRAVSSTVYIFVTTHAQTGAAVAPLTAFEAGDFILYKNGSATQRTSTSGWTITSPFDSITGLHVLAIDLSDNTDAGFYAAGSYYNLVLSPDTETVDGLVVVREVASFDIGVAPANVTQLLGTAWLTPGTAGTPDVNVKLAGGTAWGSGAITAGSIASSAITAAKFATDAIDSNALAASAVTEIQSGLSTLTQTQVSGGAYALNSSSFAFNSGLDFTTTQKAATLARVTLVDTTTTNTDMLTTAAIWQDTTAAHFTAALSIGKSIMNGVTLGTGLTINGYTGNTPQTGDAFLRIGAAGVSLSAIPDEAGVTTLLSRLSATRAGYLDNLSAGAVAQAGTALSTAQWTNTLATNLGTLAGHDPGATLGTSTLTQTQVSGGAYALNSSSFAFNAALDFTTTQKAATLARVTLTDTATNLTNLPTIPTDWLTATGLAASAVTEIQSGLSTYAGGDTSGTTTLLSRLSATRAGYLDNLSAGAVPTAAQNATAVMASVIETGVSLTQAMRAIAAAAAGKRSNSGTALEQFDAIGNAGTARIVANADSAGDGVPTLSL